MSIPGCVDCHCDDCNKLLSDDLIRKIYAERKAVWLCEDCEIKEKDKTL